MKSKLMLLGLALFTGFSVIQAQVVTIPESSKKSFNEKYPTATKVDWSNNVTSYVARFNVGDVGYTAHYHLDGTWDYTERSLQKSQLPAPVLEAYSKSRIADWEYVSSGYVENNKNEKCYRIEARKGVERKYIFYDKNGKEVKAVFGV